MTLLLSVAAISATESLQAQSLQGLLNLLANTKAADADAYTGGEKLTAEQLKASSWVYTSPQIVYSGDSSMATVAIATLRTQMPEIAKSMGLNAGSDTITFLGNSTATMQNDEDSASIPYTYDAKKGTVTFTLANENTKGTFTATATAKDGIMTMLFDADTSLDTLLKMNPKLKDDSSVQIIKAVVDQYPGIKIGATFKAK